MHNIVFTSWLQQFWTIVIVRLQGGHSFVGLLFKS